MDNVVVIASVASAVAGVFSAVATTILAWLTLQYVRATKAILAEAQATRHAQARPYVFVYFTLENRLIHLNVRNGGQTTAEHVRLHTPESFSVLYQVRVPMALQKEIPLLPPGQKFKTFLADFPNYYQRIKTDKRLPLSWDCRVTYSDPQTNERYDERFLLILA